MCSYERYGGGVRLGLDVVEQNIQNTSIDTLIDTYLDT